MASPLAELAAEAFCFDRLEGLVGGEQGSRCVEKPNGRRSPLGQLTPSGFVCNANYFEGWMMVIIAPLRREANTLDANNANHSVVDQTTSQLWPYLSSKKAAHCEDKFFLGPVLPIEAPLGLGMFACFAVLTAREELC